MKVGNRYEIVISILLIGILCWLHLEGEWKVHIVLLSSQYICQRCRAVDRIYYISEIRNQSLGSRLILLQKKAQLFQTLNIEHEKEISFYSYLDSPLD